MSKADKMDELKEKIEDSLKKAPALMPKLEDIAPLPQPTEIPLNETHIILLDLIKSKEQGVTKSKDVAKRIMEVAEHENKEVARIRSDLFRKVIIELGIDTSKYSMKINSATKSAVLEPK